MWSQLIFMFSFLFGFNHLTFFNISNSVFICFISHFFSCFVSRPKKFSICINCLKIDLIDFIFLLPRFILVSTFSTMMLTMSSLWFLIISAKTCLYMVVLPFGSSLSIQEPLLDGLNLVLLYLFGIVLT